MEIPRELSELGLRLEQWRSQRQGSKTHAVGTKQANAFGLHDMLGNVFEWTGDWFGEYKAGQVVDPRGPSSSTSRAIRGGGWNYSTRNARASLRYGNLPVFWNNYLGFRCVRE